MSVSPGTRFGPYEIVALIGKGGMGEVYRARDTRLNRDVALKISSEHFSERFEREAKAIAALNHPNICQLHDIGENYLVMELVEGETLHGPLPMDDALRIALKIAEAVEYAHERGIIHRDLKPANIKITPEGVVKVLDFGLAKALENPVAPASAGDSPTLTMGNTRAGTILGTAAYMSPEQVHGKPADRRADIFSFGALLYELLAGKNAFTGESVSDTLASVLKLDPEWNRLPAETPQSIRALLRRCLVKDRKQRLQAIGEARIILENPPPDPIPTAPVTLSAPSRSRFGAAGWIAAAVLAIVAGVASWGWLKPVTPEPRIVTHFTTPLPQGSVPFPGAIVLSSDGSRLAFLGPRRQIYVRSMDQLEAKPISGTENAGFLSFSPDGEWISYVDAETPGHLRRVAVAGGPTQILAEEAAVGGPPTQSWAEDGNIYFSSKGALLRLPEKGGKAETLATPDPKIDVFYFGAQLLPGGKDLLFSTGPTFRTAVVNLKTGKKTILLDNAPGIAQYVPATPGSAAGHLIYFAQTSGSLMAVTFDLSRLQVSGSPVPVLDGVQQSVGPFASFNFSGSGTLAYVQGAAVNVAPSTLVWVDRKGAEQPLPEPPHPFGSPKLSPTGDRVAIEVITSGSQYPPSSDVWVYDLARHTLSRVTFEASNVGPAWTPDGKRLLYLFYRNDHFEVRSVPADSSGPPATVLAVDRQSPYLPQSISPDGKALIGYRMTSTNPNDPSIAFALPLPEGSSPDPKQDAKPQPFLDEKRTKTQVAFSPDGKWVAYASNETGRSEIYVVPYPGPGGKVQVSSDGGTAPRWAGRELFYRSGNKMMAVEYQTTPAFRAETPKLLFESRNQNYDVAPDGKRFLMVKSTAEQQAEQAQLHVVVNWFEELRKRVPAAK